MTFHYPKRHRVSSTVHIETKTSDHSKTIEKKINERLKLTHTHTDTLIAVSTAWPTTPGSDCHVPSPTEGIFAPVFNSKLKILFAIFSFLERDRKNRMRMPNVWKINCQLTLYKRDKPNIIRRRSRAWTLPIGSCLWTKRQFKDSVGPVLKYFSPNSE